MKTSTPILTFTTLVASTLSLASPLSLANTLSLALSSWQVSNYSEGCSPGGCVYKFNIASPSTPSSLNEPAFSTFCTGTNVAGRMQPCENAAITANELPGSGEFTLVIEHEWTTQDGVTFFLRGNRTVEIGGYPKSFEVVQTDVSAIA